MSQEQYQRNPAVRVLASELQKADYHFQEEDQERAPKYLLLPSGGKANRVMMGGTLVGIEDASNDSSNNPFWKARINDGTGEFLAFAGQYQPEASAAMQELAKDDTIPPAYVNVVAKTKEYRPDDDEGEVIVNLRPEQVSVVSAQHRDNLLRETAERTIERLEQNEGEYVRQAEDRYGDRVDLLKDDVMDALEAIEGNN